MFKSWQHKALKSGGNSTYQSSATHSVRILKREPWQRQLNPFPTPRVLLSEKMAFSAVCKAAIAATFLGSLSIAHAQAKCETLTEEDGPDKYLLKGVSKDPFYCIAITNDSPPLSAKEVIRDQSEVQTCNVVPQKSVVSYQKTNDEQPLRCKFECKPGQFKCVETPEEGDSQCVCLATGPRAAIVPLTETENLQATIQSVTQGGASQNALESLCASKTIDSVVGAEVNCQKINKPFPKTFLTQMAPGAPLCSIQNHPKYVEGEDNNSVWVSFPGDTGAKCNLVCKPGGFKCAGDSKPSPACPCENPPKTLVPKLLPVDDNVVARPSMRMVSASVRDLEAGCQYDSQCGACGRCVSGSCKVRESGNNCEFGFKCASPLTIGADRLPGAPHHCEPNVSLRQQVCMETPGDGTRVPDMRLEGEDDEMDVCTCSPNHVEVPVRFINDKEIGPFCRPL